MLRSTRQGLRLAIILAAGAALAACNSIPVPRMGAGPPPMLRDARSLGPAPVKGEQVRISFADVTGIPGQMRFEMADALKQYAKDRNLVVVPVGDPTVTYALKGYLSAVGDATGGLLIFIWDVYDPTGQPLRRFSGQEAIGGSEADPWAAVSGGHIDAAARETIDNLADWLRT